MLKTLLKKQFLEIKNMFFPIKEGKNGKIKSAVLFVLLLAVSLSAGVVFSSALAEGLCAPLYNAGLSWLYFCLAGLITVAAGSILGIISTYISVFRATDTELLLSLPIKPSIIVFVRIISNYFIDLLLTLLLWVPFSVKYFIIASPSVLSVVFCILSVFFIPLLCTAIALFFGFLVSLITVKLKNNGLVVAFIGLITIGVFYYLYFRLMGMVETLILDPVNAGAGFKTWGVLFYQLGLAATGDVFAALIFFAAAWSLFQICYSVISINFIKMSTVSGNSVKVRKSKNPYKERDIKSALFRRETSKFLSNANYILNCGLSSVIMLGAGVAALIFKDDAYNLVQTLAGQFSIVNGFSLLVIPAFLFFMLFTGGSAIPSVSIEGKTIWVVRTLPVNVKDVLMAKEKLQLVLHFIPALFFTVSFCIVLRVAYYTAIAEIFFAVSTTLFCAAFSLYLGTMKSDVNWSNETAAIKSNIAVLLVMLTGFAFMIATLGSYYLLAVVLELSVHAEIIIAVLSVAFLVLFFVLNHKIKTKGVEKFESL